MEHKEFLNRREIIKSLIAGVLVAAARVTRLFGFAAVSLGLWLASRQY